MPVHDHPIHARTQHVNMRYGCWNKPAPMPGYWAKDGFLLKDDPMTGAKVAIQKMVWVPHVMSVACRNDVRKTDPHCKGCKTLSDTEWLESYGLG